MTSLDKASEAEALKIILGCIDLTTLEGSDTNQKITEICHKARNIHELGSGFPNVAAVCFYPPFVRLAKKELSGTNVQVASVAGAFPAGQSPLHIKLDEVKYAVSEGADEIDMVISRGKFLEGEYNLVFDEIAAIKNACGGAHLKVILETGELATINHIRKASEIAIQAGADFIKTSTGKIQPAATLEAMTIMADTVKEYYENTGEQIGLKPAGGISACEQALKYYQVVKRAAGNQWLDNTFFRIGASRLTDQIITRLQVLLG
ncbi:MAG: deoxyribose-phosphate aldolase [Bacteroidetes bacterium]|nr:deoxyribose-phosphate aldolase [Bacteroidota bacterium]